jgi:small subunit ribosomal protein S31
MFTPHKTREPKKQYVDFGPLQSDPNAEKIFGNKSKALNYFDPNKLKPISTSYWAEMERRKTELTNLSMGPTNAFEEQILWTEQGRMWPYPIDNEYLVGEEENVSFRS